MILAKVSDLDLDVAGDTPFSLPAGAKVAITALLVTNVRGSIGGSVGPVRVFPGASQTGAPVVGIARSLMVADVSGGAGEYANNPVVQAHAQTFAGGATAYLNNGVANGSALLADFYVLGEILDP